MLHANARRATTSGKRRLSIGRVNTGTDIVTSRRSDHTFPNTGTVTLQVAEQYCRCGKALPSVIRYIDLTQVAIELKRHIIRRKIDRRSGIRPDIPGLVQRKARADRPGNLTFSNLLAVDIEY